MDEEKNVDALIRRKVSREWKDEIVEAHVEVDVEKRRWWVEVKKNQKWIEIGWRNEK